MPKPKKCKQCGEKFTPQYSSIQMVCSPKCAAEYSKKQTVVKEKKEFDNKIQAMKIDTHSKEHRKFLEGEINKLSRKIDLSLGYFTCIDCDRDYGKQQDAAHFHSKGANNTIRYNLHNLHSANSHCNCYSDVHHVNYAKGIIKRYGQEYLDLIENLPIKYKEIHLSNLEVYEKLKVVRKINRDFETFKFTSGIEAREVLNKLIGIYN